MSKIVLGGGLGGLSAAYYLSKLPNQTINLIESTARTGGWIKSNKQPTGAIFEEGPRTIRPRGDAGVNTLKLVEELNLSNQIVSINSAHPAARNRMIYAKNNLHLLPNSIGGLFNKKEPFSRPLILHLLNDIRAAKKEVEDEPIYDFIERRFGAEVADYLISPLICGICAGNAKEISVRFLMSNFFDYEQRFGSITKGAVSSLLSNSKKENIQSKLVLKAKQEKWSVYSFKDGCETLPLALKKHLEQNDNININLNSFCKEIVFDKDKVIVTSDEKQFKTDHLISSLPSNLLGELLEIQHPQLSFLLKNLMKNVSVGVVNLQYDNDLISEPGFGLLVAPKEQLPILGIIFDSCCFPDTNKGTVLTVMMGGHWFEHYFGKDASEEKLLNTALQQVTNILKIDGSPVLSKVNILHNCIPQYVVGHTATLLKINNHIKEQNLPLSLCGASYYGVGINDVILSAKKAVDDLK